MQDKRGEYLNKMLGLDNAAELLDKGIETLVVELNKRGVNHKSVEKPAEAETDKAQKTFGVLIGDLIEAQAGLAELVDGVVEENKALKTENSTLKTDLLADFNKRFGAVSEQLGALKAQLDARPRSAAKDAVTEVNPVTLPREVVEAMQPPLDFFGSKYKNPYEGGR